MNNCHQQKYCCNWGLTEEQSAVVHIQALYPADGILPVISSKHQLLVINLASVPGRQLVNSPTAAILDRCLQFYGHTTNRRHIDCLVRLDNQKIRSHLINLLVNHCSNN